MLLARTQPNLLILSRKAQSRSQPLQQDAVTPDLLQQRMRLRLASRATHRQLRQSPNRPLETVKFIGCPASLPQHLSLGRRQHIPSSHRQPKPLTRCSQASRRPHITFRRLPASHAAIVRETTLSRHLWTVRSDRRPKSTFEYPGDGLLVRGRSPVSAITKSWSARHRCGNPCHEVSAFAFFQGR
jgi:hypothetical protein